MLKRIHVKGFKSLVDVEVELSPLVVVFGANAAGKSNFLEAMLLLSRLVGERTVADAFEHPALRGYPVEAFSLPAGGLPELLTQERARLSLEADLTPAQGSPLRYRVGVQIEPKQGRLSVFDEYLTRLRRDGEPQAMLPRIEPDPPHLLVRHLGKAGRSQKLDLHLNHTAASNLQLSGAKSFPDLDRLRDELAAWRSYFLDPRHAMRSPQPPRAVTDIGSRGEMLAPFLNALHQQYPKHFAAVRRALRTAIPPIESLQVQLDKQRGTLDIEIRQDDTPFSSRVISEGTLRVLALCAIAANPTPPALVAFEEPENGVHPKRIEVIAQLLAKIADREGTQLVVTSHSPTLIAEMARMRLESPSKITLLRSFKEGERSRFAPFDPAPLFRDAEIRQALTSPEDNSQLIESILVRGWLDA